MNIAIVAIACVVIFFLLPLLRWFMAKTKRPNRELKHTRSRGPPNPPPSQPPVKRPRQEEGPSTRKPSQSKGKGKAHDIPHMPHSDASKVIYQIEFERHDIPGRYFPRFQSQDDVRAIQLPGTYFLSMLTIKRTLKDYGSRFAELKVICERDFKIDDFQPNAKRPNTPINVINWIVSRGWTPILQNHVCNPHIVREFYFRGSIQSISNSSAQRIVSWVRGQEVSISAYTIREFFSLPHIENPQFPFHPSVEISTDNILSILMGAAHKWDHLRKIITGFFLPDYRVLYAIYHHCIRQDTHHSEFNVFDSLQLFAIGTGLSIDLGNLIFEGIVACLVSHHDGTGSYNALVMGSLITHILIHFYKVPHYKKEIAVKPSKGTYNIGSWHRSLSQAPIYVRAKNDADDRFLQMKARELTGSKGKIIQVSSRRIAPPPAPSEDVQGLFALMKKIIKKVEKIGKHLNIPHFDSDDDLEAPVPPAIATIVEEGEDEEEVEDSESEGNEDVSSSDSQQF
ncbi:hypothetical protein LguiA_023341 [Lonicera macranthoides]